MLRRVLKAVKDFLFPVFCVKCGLEGVWFCKQCKRRTKVRPFVFCSSVKEISLGVLAFFPYIHNSVFGNLISFWKYHFIEEISKEWQFVFNAERLFLSRYLNNFDHSQPIYLVPVPLHPRRERERGFNQAEVLSNILSECLTNCGLEVQILDFLKRVRYTSQQAKLDPIARGKNLQGAFVWQQKNIVGEQVILVDDVFTTGSTARECAQVLKSAGVKQIGMIVLAHG
jgi:ComF family protein